MKHRICSLQLLFKVYDQISLEKISVVPFGEEAERGIARIKNCGVELHPTGDAHERGNRLARLTALVTALQKYAS